MIHAEKIVTALQRETVNTRWRDFADLYLLSRQHPIDGDDLERAVQAVAQHRGVALVPLAEALAAYAGVPAVQSKWSAWRRRQQLDDRLPQSFAEVLQQIYAFADPAIASRTAHANWRPRDLAWRPLGGHA